MEITVIILLALACLWLAVRLRDLKRGIASLTESLRSGPLPDRASLHPSAARGSLDNLSSVVIDLLDEAERHRQLEEGRREVLDFVLDQIDNSIFIVDEDQSIRYSNVAARELFATERGHEQSQLIEVCLEHRIVESVALAMETGAPVQERVEFANTLRFLSVEAQSIDRTHPLGPGAWVLIRDITAELQTEQTRKDFVANASHELRTPLSIIKGHIEMLEEDIGGKTFEVLKKHTERTSKIVEDMLSISKLEGAELNAEFLSKEVFDMGDCITGVVEQLQPIIDERGTKVSVKLPEKKLREFFGDRFHFDQIFFNLIENALKQNLREGLKISVCVTHDELDEKLTIDVIDNGVGIPAADLNEVFKRFYRVEKHHSQAIKGTGLGLSIVKRAVEAHHGFISVESQPGKRTCFRIVLPVTMPE